MRVLLTLQLALLMASGGVALAAQSKATRESTRFSPSKSYIRSANGSKTSQGKKIPDKRGLDNQVAAGKKSPLPGGGTDLLTPKSELSSGEDTYTSLIIDATGLKLFRSLCPKILRTDGSEVWGSLTNLKNEDYDLLQECGVVAYAKTLDEALANSRCGSKPLIIKALDVRGTPIRSNPVISDEDAMRILNANKKAGFLNKFNVIFIQNETPTITVIQTKH
ncbi:MAG: hypothetical protein ACUVRS_01875 [Armatimonadota bacterium]